MKRTDFIRFKRVYLDTCETLIANKGICSIKCKSCPFDYKNSLNGFGCKRNNYAPNDGWKEEDSKLVENAKEYLKLYGGNYEKE